MLNFISCNNSQKKITQQTSIKSKTQKEDVNFVDDNEKITLLSICKNISVKQAYSIINEYYFKTLLILPRGNESEYYEKVIDTIAKKNKLTKQKTASIIYSYQYEIITEDEVIENYEIDRQNYLEEINPNE